MVSRKLYFCVGPQTILVLIGLVGFGCEEKSEEAAPAAVVCPTAAADVTATTDPTCPPVVASAAQPETTETATTTTTTVAAEAAATATAAVDTDSDGVVDADDCAPADATKSVLLTYAYSDVDGDTYLAADAGTHCGTTTLPSGYYATGTDSDAFAKDATRYGFGTSFKIGGFDDDIQTDMSMDSSGNVYTVGYFRQASGSVDFNFTSGTDALTPGTWYDAYVVKASADGTYGWSRKIGGASAADYANAVATDASGNVFVGGGFSGTVDFDTGGGTDNKTSSGSLDAYVTKYSSAGVYQWSRQFGGQSNVDTITAIATDASGNIYVSGVFYTTTGAVDFDFDGGTDNHASVGEDIFITKINADGTYGWTQTFGSGDWEASGGLATDTSGNVYAVGCFHDTIDFDFGGGTDSHTSAGNYDMYVMRINSDGTYGWTKTFGSTDADCASALTVDSSGNVFVGGYFSATVDFDPTSGTDSHVSGGTIDAFLMRMTSAGAVTWTKTFGGTTNDFLGTIFVKGTGVYVSGYFNGTVDFDPGSGTDSRVSAGSADGYVSRISTDGDHVWTKTVGSTGFDRAGNVAVSSTDKVWVVGTFEGTVDFDFTSGTSSQVSNVSSDDIFLMQF